MIKSEDAIVRVDKYNVKAEDQQLFRRGLVNGKI